MPHSFTVESWERNQDLFELILALPFNRELASGTLSRERFRFYLAQDGHYLSAFGRALTAASVRAPNPDGYELLTMLAREGLEVERGLHRTFFVRYDIAPAERPAPVTDAYGNFLLSTAAHGAYEQAVAALLPCYKLYSEVGRAITRTAAPGNPYQDWIDVYSGETFGENVQALVAETDRLADAASPELRGSMVISFRRSVAYEWWFWDAAYRMEDWPASA